MGVAFLEEGKEVVLLHGYIGHSSVVALYHLRVVHVLVLATQISAPHYCIHYFQGCYILVHPRREYMIIVGCHQLYNFTVMHRLQRCHSYLVHPQRGYRVVLGHN